MSRPAPVMRECWRSGRALFSVTFPSEILLVISVVTDETRRQPSWRDINPRCSLAQEHSENFASWNEILCQSLDVVSFVAFCKSFTFAQVLIAAEDGGDTTEKFSIQFRRDYGEAFNSNYQSCSYSQKPLHFPLSSFRIYIPLISKRLIIHLPIYSSVYSVHVYHQIYSLSIRSLHPSRLIRNRVHLSV